jgi:hypothetical protein
MIGEDPAAPEWVKPLCDIALNWKKGSLSIRQHFQNASPDLSDGRFRAFVGAHLSHRPALITAWQGYSEDKRTSPSPYLDGRKVGFFEVSDREGRRKHVRQYRDRATACADFIYREAMWVLENRRVSGLPG